MISTELARDLRDAGLVWDPVDGDRFLIPDRDLDDRVFRISDMVCEVRHTPAGAAIAFNGTTEWALDAIMLREVIWLPHEHQLRERLGNAFAALERDGDHWHVLVEVHEVRTAYTAPTAADAYGRALLHHLRPG
ncbi:pilus assembly protein CpaE [Euzebya sp.]|uniref:pilus assembly protein CpaE n=1 Tax=Euzebya sp. TaxID=1971409 RepID=UPI003514D099